jgi:CubicO group peptidase (beta-lactamase class C family)
MAHARNVFVRITLVFALLHCYCVLANMQEPKNYAFGHEGWTTNMAVISQGDQILWEHYGHGYEAKDLHFSWSIAKTVNALLFGVLEYEGLLSRNDSIEKLAPAAFQLWNELGLKQVESWNPHFYSPRNITIQNLIQMCSGIAFYEDYGDHPYESDIIPMLYGTGSGAVAGVALGRPLQHRPGTHFYYSTGDTHLSQWALKQFLKSDYLDIVDKKLFSKLGISNFRVESDKTGVYLLGSYVSLSTRDYLKLARLIMQDGTWNGERLIASDWIKLMTTPSDCYQNTQVTGDQLRPYGAGLWLNYNLPATASLKNYPWLSHDTWDMKGRGGQSIVMNKELDLIALRFGHNHSGYRFKMEDWVYRIYRALHEKN